MKILYQSYINRELSNTYFEHLGEHVDHIKSDNTEVVLGEMNPPDRYAHAAVEYACGFQAIRNAVKAEKEGYDAVVLGHFQDSGLLEAKAVVDIPVLGLGEISMLYACTLGKKIGLITINPRFIPGHEEQVTRYGIQDRVTGIRAIEFQPGQILACLEDKELINSTIESFKEQAKPLVDAGAEVIIPAGGIPMLMASKVGGFDVDGAPVLNGIPVVVRHAETAVELAKINGHHTSRSGMFSKVPEDIVSELYG